MYSFAEQRSGKSLLSYQPRRPVPWGAFDVVLVLSLYFVIPVGVAQVARDWLGIDAGVPAQVGEGEKTELDAAHPLARLLVESHSPWVIVVCIVATVVIAPITEELFFRLLLQGWLEAVERRLRRRMPQLRLVTAGVMSVGLTSLLFAALHFRTASPRLDLATLIFLVCVRAVANLVTVGLALCWVRFAAGATLADIGIVPRKLAADVKLGMLAFFVVTVPVYALMIVVKTLLPDGAVADPIPLLLLAVVLGGLYYRTHRIGPSIVLHMAFNATGVILALWMPQ
jgi:membrane protease YdiL (CAAX protease family)